MRKLNLSKKDIIYIVSLPLFQCALYFIAKFFAFNIHIMSSPIDDMVPFIPQFVYFYCCYFIILLTTPYLVNKYSKNRSIYTKTYIISSIIGFIIFIIYPTVVLRPELKVNNLSTFVVSIIYYFDTPALNCFPSFHTLNSVLSIMFISMNKNAPKKLRIFIFVLALGIILSTIFIKQHVIYDLIAALLIAIVSYLISILISKIKR